ncbi:MAG: HD domain-containing protein [Clostridia bacterium]|nr:HD domain-containing protein [Clostridia bacterium]
MSITEAAIAYARQLFQNNSGGHDAEHTLRVYRNALEIASLEAGCDLEIVSLAALLHDADDHKLFVTENNANARAFLTAHGVARDRMERIITAINSVSFSRNRGKRPETIEGKIVQDADRLDAIGAVGIARAFAFGGEHGRSLDASIRHFHDKLLLLKDEMNTKAGREMAEKRHQYMVEFLDEFERETAGRRAGQRVRPSLPVAYAHREPRHP